MRLLALSLVLALVACGGKSKPTTAASPDPAPAPADPAPVAGAPKPLPSEAELEKLFAHTLEFVEELAAGIDGSVGDCKKMAGEIDRVFTKHQDFLAEAKSYDGNPEFETRTEAFMKTHQDRLGAATGKIGPGMDGCKDDPAMQDVMNRFSEI